MDKKVLATLGIVLSLASVSLPAAAEDIMLISSHTRDFIGADENAGGILKGMPLETQALVLDRIALEGGKVAFRTAGGQFLRAGIGAETLLAATSQHIRGWETFEIVRVTAAKFAIKSVQNGLYVRLGPDDRLAAVSAEIGSRETFSSRTVEAAAVPQPQPEAVPQDDRLALSGNWRIHRVRTFDGSLTAVPQILRDDTFLRIRENGRLSASIGCNDISARVRAENELVEFGDVMTTKKLCFDEAGTYELLLLIAFDHSSNFDGEGNQLRFFDVNGDPVMVLRRN